MLNTTYVNGLYKIQQNTSLNYQKIKLLFLFWATPCPNHWIARELPQITF